MRELPPLSSTPTVSVVIPLHNARPYIGAALESALTQSYPITEVIVIDDGSTDDPQSALGALRSRIRYVHTENNGAAYARNLGAHLAQGELIAFLDADDMWLSEKIEKQLQCMRKTGSALVYCGRYEMDEAGADLGIFDQHEFPQGDILERLIAVNHISSTSLVLVRKDVFESLGGFNESPQLKVSEDFELWCRIAARFAIGAVPEPLIRYRLHPRNTSANPIAAYRGKIAALDFLAHDLQRNALLTESIEKVILERKRFTHEHYAWGLLQAEHYADARTAARALMSLEGDIPIALRALSLLPPWLVGCVHRGKRLAGRLRPKSHKT